MKGYIASSQTSPLNYTIIRIEISWRFENTISRLSRLVLLLNWKGESLSLNLLRVICFQACDGRNGQQFSEEENNQMDLKLIDLEGKLAELEGQ